MNPKTITLLSCRSPFLDSDRIYPPLANLYLHSVIKNHFPDAEVTITDDYSVKGLQKIVEESDLVGVSIMTPQRTEAYSILNRIKQQRRDLPVVAGGPHCRYYLGSVLQEPWDFIVTNDGERSIVSILSTFGEAKLRVFADGIPPKEFHKFAVKPARLENEEFLRTFNYKLNGRDSTTMMCAKGCPESCSFCEDARTGVKWTPLELIIDELDDIKRLGYGGVYIFDDIFAIAQKKIEPIAKALKERDLIYRCNGQARLFNPEFAKMLAETGCYEIAFGAESGSQKILDNVQKRTTVQMNYDFVKWAKAEGIIVKAFLMLGLPGENIDTVRATEEFIATSGIDDFQLAIFYPYQGTQIRAAINEGKPIDLKIEREGLGAYGQKGGYSESVIRTAALSREDIFYHRERLIQQYKPKAHQTRWEDKFFDTHLAQESVKPDTELTQFEKMKMRVR